MKRFKKSEYSENFDDGIIEAQNEMIENGLPEIIEEVVNEPEVIAKELAKGIVIDCEKLNVREKPNKDSKVLYILDKSSEVKVDKEAPTAPDFVKVITVTGLEGYCMSKYILVM